MGGAAAACGRRSARSAFHAAGAFVRRMGSNAARPALVRSARHSASAGIHVCYYASKRATLTAYLDRFGLPHAARVHTSTYSKPKTTKCDHQTHHLRPYPISPSPSSRPPKRRDPSTPPPDGFYFPIHKIIEPGLIHGPLRSILIVRVLTDGKEYAI